VRVCLTPARVSRDTTIITGGAHAVGAHAVGATAGAHPVGANGAASISRSLALSTCDSDEENHLNALLLCKRVDTGRHNVPLTVVQTIIGRRGAVV
jgi:hypothetical protein